MSLDLRFWIETHLVEPENTLRTTVYRRASATEILTLTKQLCNFSWSAIFSNSCAVEGQISVALAFL